MKAGAPMRGWIVAGAVLAVAWGCGGRTVLEGAGGGDGSGSSSGAASSSGASGSGGSTSGSGSGGGSGSGSGSGGGSGGSSSGSPNGPECPKKQPHDFDACPIVGLECEYGDSPNWNCDVIVTCDASGWRLPELTPACPAGVCPSSFALADQEKPCTPLGFECQYAQGFCACSYPQPVGQPDGPLWVCTQPQGECPEPRPRLGDTCTQDTLVCDYASCYGGLAVVCKDDVWYRTELPCPAGAAP